jgi:hypothetical protein
MSVLPRNVLCVLGKEGALSTFQELLAGEFADFEFDDEYSIAEADERMPRAFHVSAAAGASTITKADRDAIGSHGCVAYLLSPRIEQAASLELAGRALRLVAECFERGALAVKAESVGLAHGKRRWQKLARDYQEAMATGDEHSARAALYFAWVQRPIRDEGLQYSVGMHLLGVPDTEVDSSLDYDEACQWIDLMGLYLVADRPTRPVKTGEGFRLAEEGPRRVIEKHACSRYEADDFFHNPFGYHRLVTP